MKLNNILKDFQHKLSNVTSLEALETLKKEFLGKDSILTLEIQSLKSLNDKERSVYGPELNEMKKRISNDIDIKRSELERLELEKLILSENIDVTLPGRDYKIGTLHPITKMYLEIKNIFLKMGFNFHEGPEIESTFRNFDALNVPESHPSRNLSDTFYFDTKKLLRTHTTTVQIKCLEEQQLPILSISFGKVYRPDYDASHTPMFHQFEGIFLMKNSNFAHLKGVLNEMVTSLFPNTKTRFRPHYFPFTEPSAELDMSCSACVGVGCSVCKHSGWLEILGCGMVSPEVLKHFNYTLDDVTGFAFGMGVERLAMIKYGIKDIRLLYENDLKLLKQFI